MDFQEYLLSVVPADDIRALNDSVLLYYPKSGVGSGEKDGNFLAIDWILSHTSVDEVKIICLGNRLYGNLVTEMWDKYPNIHINLLVSSPESIADIHQRTAVEKKIKTVLEHNQQVKEELKTKLNVTAYLPTLRACVLYSNSKPVLCCYQRYQNSSFGVKGRKKTPCFIVEVSDTDNFVLDSLVHNCEIEFDDLLDEHSVLVKLDERGELYYE